MRVRMQNIENKNKGLQKKKIKQKKLFFLQRSHELTHNMREIKAISKQK